MIEAISVEKKLPVTVIDYRKTPLSLEQLQELQRQLALPVRAMLRENEDEYATLALAQEEDSGLLAALASHPQLLQRPIVSFQGKAAIGRPAENVLSLFEMKAKVTT